MAPLWTKFTVLAASSLLLAAGASAQEASRLTASPGYLNRDSCPERCAVVGHDPSDWYAYKGLEEFRTCDRTMFYYFNLYDQVDDANQPHRVYACTSCGPDWGVDEVAEGEHQLVRRIGDGPFCHPRRSMMLAGRSDGDDRAANGSMSASSSTSSHSSPSDVAAKYELGWWHNDGEPATVSIQSLSKQMRNYLANNQNLGNKTTMLFAQSGKATIGLYVGEELNAKDIGTYALQGLESGLHAGNIPSSSMALQNCQPHYDSEHIFGVVATSNGTFSSIQKAMQTWHSGSCLSFGDSLQSAGPAFFAKPLIVAGNDTASKSTATSASRRSTPVRLPARGECRAIKVQPNHGCPELAQDCGISPSDFTKYNPGKTFCSGLQPGMHVCCSSGTLPDYRPRKNSDGSCASVKVGGGDTCAGLAAANSLTQDELEGFNKNKTWGWSGCNPLFAETVICLSDGTPPMPATIANAVCGPQVAGTKQPSDTKDIADLNPCPLNACCDIWGFCGVTKEFCTDTNTGNPGTAKKGTNGCISNCGTDIKQDGGPSEFRTIGYFEGYQFSSRQCLWQDARQIDGSKYTHLHFGFGDITPDFQISAGKPDSQYEFMNFKLVSGGAKKIISFGGWDFSTSPSTYTIFREGVNPNNRDKLASNIAKFVEDNSLDGVDIDWEYPGAPDIPNIPPGSKQDGINYLKFLVVLKSKLNGKSLSIAAPASFWYLKGFPIKRISQVVDYIVYMTYDLHGQWDSQNKNSQEGCDDGMCLRSGVNLTETKTALSMVTKAGVPSSKLAVGVTSYGRSFGMAQAGCYGPSCKYLGGPLDSQATKGVCTNTGGYIADAEIYELMRDPKRVTKSYKDKDSDSNILVYDNTQWVSYMDEDTLASRTKLYKGYNMGGTTNWAIDLEEVSPPPPHSSSWSSFYEKMSTGGDPYQVGTRNGNWTNLKCSDPAVSGVRNLTAAERWEALDCDDAWKDLINVWKTIDRPEGSLSFSESLSATAHGPELSKCGNLLDTSNCNSPLVCAQIEGPGTGPAAYEIWNSLVIVHEMYASYAHALTAAMAKSVNPALDDFLHKFAPVEPPPDNKWLLLLIDMVTLGASMVAGPFFNSFLSKLPYFVVNENALGNIKDTTMTVIGQSTTIAKDLLGSSGSDWTPDKQAEFSNYMGQTVTVWSKSLATGLSHLFRGQDGDIDTLWNIIKGGKLIAGRRSKKSKRDVIDAADLRDSDSDSLDGGDLFDTRDLVDIRDLVDTRDDGDAPKPGDDDYNTPELEASVSKAFFGYAIPALWSVSGAFPVVLDTGYACGKVDPIKGYMTPDTMHKTYACVDNKMYYLGSAKGDAQYCYKPAVGCPDVCRDEKFTAPPGLDSLDKTSFGGVTLQDLVEGSVRTYKANGNSNKGKTPDATEGKTFDSLFDQDIRTPGFISIPVCSPDMAYKAWRSWKNKPDKDQVGYPCIDPK
ncbi:Killer toxin subunits alpha/beta [Beauveria bassiana D1-5]|uniref:chitinase n=1 Tax=Beauveria bassiana D1-5 TaxID=1245745 RepID=A0A0A2VXC7_BEABA|nr:Killer toxin subunits alpha/beta [Beauveria bassiana D1-5]